MVAQYCDPAPSSLLSEFLVDVGRTIHALGGGIGCFASPADEDVYTATPLDSTYFAPGRIS